MSNESVDDRSEYIGDAILRRLRKHFPMAMKRLDLAMFHARCIRADGSAKRGRLQDIRAIVLKRIPDAKCFFIDE